MYREDRKANAANEAYARYDRYVTSGAIECVIRGDVMSRYRDSHHGGNLLDNLLTRMEQYATNLESLVQKRTADYEEQKKRAVDLLYRMLPRYVPRYSTVILVQCCFLDRYNRPVPAHYHHCTKYWRVDNVHCSADQYR